MDPFFLQWDSNVVLFFQNLGGWLLPIMNFFSFLGSEYTYLIILPLIYWCIDATIGLRMGIMMVLSVGINGILKFAFHTPRPYWVDAHIKAYAAESSFGLPSGHAMNAITVWGVMAAGFKKRWLTILSILVILLIGISRMYLGVHFLSDILTGWLFGGLLLILFLILEKPFTTWFSRLSMPFQLVFCLGMSLLLLLIGFLTRAAVSSSFIVSPAWMEQALLSSDQVPDPLSLEGLITIAGVFFGLSAGYVWLTQKYGKFTVQGSISHRALRFFAGIVCVAILYVVLKVIAPAQPGLAADAFRFFRYAVLGAWVTAGAPLLFKKLKLDR